MPLLCWNVRHALLHHGKIKRKLKRHLVHIAKGNAVEYQTEIIRKQWLGRTRSVDGLQ